MKNTKKYRYILCKLYLQNLIVQLFLRIKTYIMGIMLK